MAGQGSTRTFLFLQGPHGPYFRMLAEALRVAGYRTVRINFNGGDRVDWGGEAIHYRGRAGNWPLFFDDVVVEHGVTDLILFGDCRPRHAVAHSMAKLRDVAVHVVEEGYIRPDFVTLEDEGVNGHSTLPKDPEWYRGSAQGLPPLDEAPPVPASFRRRLRETARYTLATMLLRPLYPFHVSHRSQTVGREAIGWAWRLLTNKRQQRRSEAAWAKLRDRRFFALPLQLNTDYQLRVHSPFGDMRQALRFVIKSFAAHAPADVSLIVKRHPLDPGLTGWGGLTRRVARRYGVSDRVHYLPGSDVADIVTRSIGVVTVNSTVGTLALNENVPVAVLGNAVYDVPGIVHQGSLDDFWWSPMPPDDGLYDAFKRVLVDRCLIRGGFLSDQGLAMLVRHAVARLERSPRRQPPC